MHKILFFMDQLINNIQLTWNLACVEKNIEKTHTDTHTHIYIYIERERERERCFKIMYMNFLKRI